MLFTDSTMKRTEMSYAVQNIIISHSSHVCTEVDGNNKKRQRKRERITNKQNH